MDMGIFFPTLSSGWLATTEAPPFEATFETWKALAQKAEQCGLDFLLAPVKLRGLGGECEFWDHSPEPLTLVSALAAVTTRIKLYSSVAILTMPAPIAARIATTIERVSGGRFGLNIVSGWQPAEYEQMGVWPGDHYFADRYEHTEEYVTILKDLWRDGRSDLHGKYFTMKDCVMTPTPKTKVSIVCAGQSDRGLRFCAEFGDYMFCLSVGINTPTAHAALVGRLVVEAERTGRDVGAYIAIMVLADETDEAAFKRWKHYNDTVDRVTIQNLFGQTSADKTAGDVSTAKAIVQGDVENQEEPLPEGAVNLHFGTLVGSYENVARMLDEVASVPGTKGIMMIFDDWFAGLEAFNTRIEPLMEARKTKRLKAAA